MRKLAKLKSNREPTIALINIVFLMLVFFMVAGTLSQPLDKDLSLVNTQDLEGRAPPDALVIHADGRLSYQGSLVSSAAAFLASKDAQTKALTRVIPDRTLSASRLVQIAKDLRLAGSERVIIVTERALQ